MTQTLRPAANQAKHPVPQTDGPFGLAVLLAALAGWIDAVGVAGSAGVFLSFMSGNTTQLAISLARQEWTKAALLAAVLAAFVLGVLVGELIDAVSGRFGRPVVLVLEAALLGSGAALQWHTPQWPPLLAPFECCPLVLAMGMQNACMRRAGGINIGLTYVTGTLVQLGRSLADAVRGNGGGSNLVKYLTVWLSLACGAAIGTIALSVSELAALVGAATSALGLAAATALWR